MSVVETHTHTHIHLHVDFGPALEKIDLIQKTLNEMSAQNDKLVAKIDRLTAAVSGVKADVKYVKDKLSSAENGLTAEETEALDAKLAPVVDALEALDAETDSTTTTEPEA